MNLNIGNGLSAGMASLGENDNAFSSSFHNQIRERTDSIDNYEPTPKQFELPNLT